MTRRLIKLSLPRLLVFLLVLLAFVFPFFVSRICASSEDVAASAISQAEEVMASAYRGVLDAEQVGAEVSGLLVGLNEAGELLEKAQAAFMLGDSDETVRLAHLCSQIGENVKNDAYELRTKAFGSKVMNSWLTMTGSVIVAVAVAFGSFLAWRSFKRRYVQKVLRMKLEVEQGES